MYAAKDLADEVPRMVMILGQERRGELSSTHRQCSMSADVPVEDNHLTCCLGTECRKCPELLSLENAELSPEQIDAAKAWTCAAHIVSQPHFVDTSEGFLLSVDDRMYWENTYTNLATDSGHPDDEQASPFYSDNTGDQNNG